MSSQDLERREQARTLKVGRELEPRISEADEQLQTPTGTQATAIPSSHRFIPTSRLARVLTTRGTEG